MCHHSAIRQVKNNLVKNRNICLGVSANFHDRLAISQKGSTGRICNSVGFAFVAIVMPKITGVVRRGKIGDQIWCEMNKSKQYKIEKDIIRCDRNLFNNDGVNEETDE